MRCIYKNHGRFDAAVARRTSWRIPVGRSFYITSLVVFYAAFCGLISCQDDSNGTIVDTGVSSSANVTPTTPVVDESLTQYETSATDETSSPDETPATDYTSVTDLTPFTDVLITTDRIPPPIRRIKPCKCRPCPRQSFPIDVFDGPRPRMSSFSRERFDDSSSQEEEEEGDGDQMMYQQFLE
uniref:Uncharacterized protein n=1 Tax=Timema tahoe TaxID=61484 RepID=A0A7R9IRR2_9NEOP|nr:unnamed protein product [Timema tahoe]